MEIRLTFLSVRRTLQRNHNHHHQWDLLHAGEPPPQPGAHALYAQHVRQHAVPGHDDDHDKFDDFLLDGDATTRRKA